MGEAKRKELACQKSTVALDTFGGRIHVEWNPSAAVTPLGQLPFFIEFLKVSGLFEAWVADCPLNYQSNNTSDKRDVLATFLLSILAGHHRYAHITAIRQDGIHPELLSVKQLVSEDAARRALKKLDEVAGNEWLDRHLGKTTQPLLTTPWILDLDAKIKCLYGKQEGAVVGNWLPWSSRGMSVFVELLAQHLDGGMQLGSFIVKKSALLMYGIFLVDLREFKGFAQ